MEARATPTVVSRGTPGRLRIWAERRETSCIYSTYADFVLHPLLQALADVTDCPSIVPSVWIQKTLSP